MNRFNVRYGHRSTCCLYAGLTDRPVPVIIPHGVFKPSGIIGRERETPDLPVLAYPEYRDAVYRDAGYDVIPSASPFLYALKMYPVRPRPDDGTLFMAAHSAPGIALTVQFEPLIEQMRRLPQPVTVCLHPYDYRGEPRRLFRQAGFTTMHAGDYNDILFLPHLIEFIGDNRFVATNMIGTSTYYALACERPVWFIGERPVGTLRDGRVWNHGEPLAHEIPVMAACRERHEDITETQRELARYFLRADAILTPDEMRTVLTEGKI